MRVSRSTDDLASLVPRNVMRMLPVPSSRWTSGARPEALPTSRTRRSYVSFPYSKSRQRGLTQVTIRVVTRSVMSRGRLRGAPALGPGTARCASRCLGGRPATGTGRAKVSSRRVPPDMLGMGLTSRAFSFVSPLTTNRLDSAQGGTTRLCPQSPARSLSWLRAASFLPRT